MLVKEVAEKLGLKILAAGQDQEVTSGYVSDLLSDVIANAEEGCLWITVQRHLNIVAVAQLKKLAGIILSRGSEPEAAVLARAEQEGLFVLSDPRGFVHRRRQALRPDLRRRMMRAVARSCSQRYHSFSLIDRRLAWKLKRSISRITNSTGN